MPARSDRPWTRTWALLTPEERRQAAWLLPLVTLMALAEAGGVAILAPFLELLTGPDAVHDLPWAAWTYDALGFEQPRAFLLAFGAAVMVALLAANGVLVVGTWALYRFAAQRGHALSMRLLEGYLHEPYERFRTRSSADVVDTVVQEAREVAEEILVPGVRLVAKAASVVGITALLVLVDPVMAAVLAGVLGGAYLLLAAVTRRRLAALGRARSGADRAVLRVAQEAAAGRKEVTLAHAETAVAARFARPSQAYADAEASKHVLRHVPRYALEGVAFAGLVAVVVLLMGTGRAVADLVPTLGLYAFAGYRLIPALHLVYEGVTRVRYGSEALDAVYARLATTPHAPHAPHAPGAPTEGAAGLPDLTDRIAFEDVHYAYPGTAQDGTGADAAGAPPTRAEVLRGVDATFDVGTTVAIVGPTGSGKTTLLDVLLGLVTPTRGAVTIDGVPLGPETTRSWWRQVGYVAQAPFLADDTVAGNVAFGAAGTHVDEAAVARALRTACLDDVVAALPQGLHTPVGEGAARLSGGQRQRLALARALYRDPAVLVLDEATNALDEATEAEVLARLRSPTKAGRPRTVVLVTHRVGALRAADAIHVLEAGRIVDVGTYDALFGRDGRRPPAAPPTPPDVPPDVPPDLPTDPRH